MNQAVFTTTIPLRFHVERLSGVTRVFGAWGRSNEIPPPPPPKKKNRDLGITPTGRFSVKDTLWLPELSFILQSDN